jgi:hypothetical protein
LAADKLAVNRGIEAMRARQLRYWLLPFVLLSTPAAAQLPSNSLPAYITDQRVLVGHFRYKESEAGLTIDVRLGADHRASYRITEGPEARDFIVAEGVWTYEAGTIHIHNQPGPVRLDPAGVPVRDPTVALSVTVRLPDGASAQGLGVMWKDAGGRYAMADGRHVVSANETVGAREVYLLRLADRAVLQKIAVKPGGPNSFRFTYYPSDQEPFDIPAIALDPKVLEVEVGTSYARLSRVPD